MQRRLGLIVAVCAVGVAVLAGLAWRSGAFESKTQAAIGGPFTLADQNGARVDETLLKGKWSAVFFGFTYCPDVCPTTLQALAAARDQLGPKGRNLRIVFISVDPERDTPAQLKTYLSGEAFPKDAIGLTGSPAQVAVAAKAYKVFYEKAGTGPDYLVNHSTPTYLMDPKGRFNRVIPFGLPPEEIANQISKAMRGD